MAKAPHGREADISVNRKALREYHILERFEAGLELVGTEVKSIRGGLANVSGAFARVENGQVFAYDVDVQPYVRALRERSCTSRFVTAVVTVAPCPSSTG